VKAGKAEDHVGKLVEDCGNSQQSLGRTGKNNGSENKAKDEKRLAYTIEKKKKVDTSLKDPRRDTKRKKNNRDDDQERSDKEGDSRKFRGAEGERWPSWEGKVPYYTRSMRIS